MMEQKVEERFVLGMVMGAPDDPSCLFCDEAIDRHRARYSPPVAPGTLVELLRPREGGHFEKVGVICPDCFDTFSDLSDEGFRKGLLRAVKRLRALAGELEAEAKERG